MLNWRAFSYLFLILAFVKVVADIDSYSFVLSEWEEFGGFSFYLNATSSIILYVATVLFLRRNVIGLYGMIYFSVYAFVNLTSIFLWQLGVITPNPELDWYILPIFNPYIALLVGILFGATSFLLCRTEIAKEFNSKASSSLVMLFASLGFLVTLHFLV